MKSIITLIAFAFFVTNTEAQLLRRIKEKADQAVEKKTDKPTTGVTEKKSDQTKTEEKSSNNDTNYTGSNNNSDAGEATKKELKVFSKFDFVPGSTILYFDNFEKDNTGETPLGWITNKSAELVTIEGLEGNWLKLSSMLSRHISRSKKQSWGNNFTIEFDMLIVKKDYDPRMGIALINSNGKMVTDEAMLMDNKPVLLFESIIVAGSKSRVSLTNMDGKVISDNMSEELRYESTTPVHISICVQGKRFRMWWNEKKLYDMSAINEQYMPNQFGFTFGSVGGSEFYLSNIRVAKDVPDTRAKFDQGKIVSNLLFYTGTSNLKPESMGSLLDISKVLKEVTSPVKIIGHTDSDGDDASNQKLSQQRAETVKSILSKQYGIDASMLSTEGRGETQPIADNKNAEGKAQNRRVEFIFKPEADVYTKPAGVTADNPKPSNSAKPATSSQSQSSNVTGSTSVKLQSKILTVNFPFAQIMKTGENTYTFIAGKEEGSYKQNFLKIELETVNMSLKPETFNFKEINQKNPLYGAKKFSEIKKTETVLYYGAGTSPYIYKFSPIIANGHMASYVTESLERKLPAASANCKFVIEKVEGGMASGYFVFGIMNKGLKPITKGDAMTETFTDGFAGEMKCTFANVPVN